MKLYKNVKDFKIEPEHFKDWEQQNVISRTELRGKRMVWMLGERQNGGIVWRLA